MKNTFLLYNDEFGSFSYGEGHPMRPFRLRLCYELICALGLDQVDGARVVRAEPAGEEDLLLVHDAEYLRVLKEADSGQMPAGGAAHGLGAGDNPVFRGVYKWSALSAGASLQAAELVLETGGRAFNMAGGLHHAMAGRAAGFCYINDAALAIRRLVDRGARVVYVDVDAHHGDGVQRAFYDTERVLTISLHETGRSLFPGTGFVTETGEGRGRGYSVNLPLPPGTKDAEYLEAFGAVVPDLVRAFSPDVLVTQLGADSLYTDPLTHLGLTVRGFEQVVKAFASMDLPWAALGGGGYDMSATARAWAAAWAVMNNVEAPDEMPEDFVMRYPDIFRDRRLRGRGRGHEARKAGGAAEGAEGARAHEPRPDPGIMREIEESIRYIKEEILPSIKRGS